MHHIANDWPRPNQGNGYNNIAEGARAKPRQHLGLCPALNLEDPNRIGFSYHLIDRWIMEGKVIQVNWDFTCRSECRSFCDNGEHSQSEDVDFYQPGVLERVFVPLDNHTVRHCRRFSRHTLGEG